jgi:hypothetical protein
LVIHLEASHCYQEGVIVFDLLKTIDFALGVEDGGELVGQLHPLHLVVVNCLLVLLDVDHQQTHLSLYLHLGPLSGIKQIQTGPHDVAGHTFGNLLEVLESPD